MLIGYSMPPATAAITGGTWLTADGGAACCDGKPGRRARLQWGAGNTTANFVAITLALAVPAFARVFGLLGSTLPSGVRVEFVGPAGGSLGAGTDVRTAAMPDGTTAAWGIGDGAAAVSTVIVRIYNDRDGATWANSGTIIDLGELVAMPAVTLGIGDGWGVETVDPSSIARTRGGQVNVARQSAYRVLTARIAGLPTSSARGGGLANGMDLSSLAAALRGGARCCAIPQYRDMVTRAVDPALAARSAIYGLATQIPDVTNISRGYFTGQLVVEEIPAR